MLQDIINALLRWLRPGMTPDEVSAALDGLVHDQNLDWRHSIVDLLKLLNMDSSLAARRILAKDLGRTSYFGGSSEDNIWLHKKVLARIAQRNIKLPS